MQIEIRRLHEELKVTTIYVTHDQREALTMSDRIAVINRGRFEQVGAPRSIYERPANSFVADFIGDAVVIPLSGEPGHRTLSGQVIRSQADSAAKCQACLVMRPEKLKVLKGGEGEVWNRFSGTVFDAVYQGDSTLLAIALDGGEQILLRQGAGSERAERQLSAGERVQVGLHEADALVVPAGEPS
jgi:putative spermidine/putrescine transport system ATP-binding protein